jgi:hypothetical protein
VGDGNLLKEAWPTSTDDNYFKGRLKTNEDMPRVPYKSKSMAMELAAAGTNTTELLRVVDKWMDVKYMLRYMAVDRAINNWDGIVTFYCGSDGRSCGNHNFFLYEAENMDRLYLIPWDMDLTFWLTTHLDPVAPWDAPPADCNMRWTIGGNKIASAGCNPIFRGLVGAGKPAWQAAVKELLDGPFNVARMQADLDRWAAQIAPSVMTDKTVVFGGWQGAVANFKSDLAIMREKMEYMRDGKSIDPYGLRLDGNNDFEAASRVNLLLGSTKAANAASAFSHTLNASSPVAGTADLKIDFEFRNDNAMTPWSWGSTTLNMKGGPQSLGPIRQIRFRTKGTANRSGRLELESPANTDWSGGRWGWDVRFTAASSTITVDLATVAIPSWSNGKAAGPKADVLANVSGLMFGPQGNGYDSKGFFTAGSDKGAVQIDEIEFLR